MAAVVDPPRSLGEPEPIAIDLGLDQKTSFDANTQNQKAAAAAPRRSESSLQPFEALGSYQVLKQLGSGGMAQVYLARSRLGGQVDKLVALKTVLPEFGPQSPLGALFLEEARVSATFQHPNVVQVFDYGEVAGRPFLAMEFLHGRDATALLQRQVSRGRVPMIQAAVAIALEISRALEYVHARADFDGRPLNLVHRDVSPANIVLSPQGEVKLVDFGVASTEGASWNSGAPVGKYRYMCAEQGLGQAPKPEWDLFALGAVLYELLTLTRFSSASSVEQLLGEVQAQKDRRPSRLVQNLDPELDALVARATAHDPKARFADASAFRAALTSVQARVGPCNLGAFVTEVFGADLKQQEEEIQNLVVTARKMKTLPPGSTPPVPVPRSPRWAWAASAAAVLALALSIAVVRRPAQAPTPVVATTPSPSPAIPKTQVMVSFASTPAGASVTRIIDGRVLGRTPLTLPLADAETALRFELDGHQPVEKRVRLVSDLSLEVALPETADAQSPKKVAPAKKRAAAVVRDGFVDPFR